MTELKRYSSFRVYYKRMKDSIAPKYEDTKKTYEELVSKLQDLYNKVSKDIDVYKQNYKLDLNQYKEFTDNTYIDGSFLEVSKDAFTNKRNNYTAVTKLYTLYKLAKTQKEVYDVFARKTLYSKMLNLSIYEYLEIVRTYYFQVQKELIIKGNGYAFEPPLGYICINRCKIVKGRKKLDFLATRKNKEKLIAAGERLWNKEEAEYANKVGIEYKGVDYRVYLNREYAYEIPLINCYVDRSKNLELKPSISCNGEFRVKTDEQILEECNYDTNVICGLVLDIRSKLRLCLKADELLYLNFIRNEAQQSMHTPAANRKS